MLDFIIHLRSTMSYLQSRLLARLVYSFPDRGISVGEKSSEKDGNCDVTRGSAGSGSRDRARAERSSAARCTGHGVECGEVSSLAASPETQQERPSQGTEAPRSEAQPV